MNYKKMAQIEHALAQGVRVSKEQIRAAVQEGLRVYLVADAHGHEDRITACSAECAREQAEACGVVVQCCLGWADEDDADECECCGWRE